MNTGHPRLHSAGFTLAELAVVLLVVTLLLGGLLVPLGAQIESRKVADTDRILTDVREALLGFAAANGRLPCPATGGATGVEAPLGGGDCSNDIDGFVPAITLALTPTDAQGYAVDAWGQRIRYALSVPTSTPLQSETGCTSPLVANSLSTLNGIKTQGIECLRPNFEVCSGLTPACVHIADAALAVLISPGRNGAMVSNAEEKENHQTHNRIFVSHEPTGAGINAFDDIVIWLSPNILYNRMIAAGRLP